ncbi:rCG59679, isoform CRA_b [Rattus norvegicus]|uniref:RCG59679, isoform CRA_b n=1 Tax=Rattus norvegicus TaxID=10116 RepID=A6HT09_RAT|nr:rCG59679, isoform CRA_b [Rattus norvegicus]
MMFLSPAWNVAAQRCPQTCVCDNSRRHVTCQHQNLTEVPDTIPEISPRAFSGLGKGLQGLYLQQNQLQSLPAPMWLSGLELIDLSGNPFHCDCQLLPLHRWLTGLNLRVGATCATPPSVRGQKVKAAASVFEACPGWIARKAKRTPTSGVSARRTPIHGWH